MKIVALCGSPRGSESATLRLTQELLNGAMAAGADVELVDVTKINVAYCRGCGACHIVGTCVLKDDFEDVREKLLACDGLVLASPNYFNSITAQLKTALDRLSGEIHCQEFLGKYGCAVATAGGPESDVVNDYLDEVLLRLGCSTVGSVGASPAMPGSMDKTLEEAQALGKELVKAIAEKREYPEQEPSHAAMLERFKMLIGFNKDVWRHEYEYFQGKGWL